VNLHSDTYAVMKYETGMPNWRSVWRDSAMTFTK